jgi:hypothetical protein
MNNFKFHASNIICILIFALSANAQTNQKEIIYSNDSKKNTSNSIDANYIGTNEFFFKGQYLEAGITTNGTFGTITNTPNDFVNYGKISIITDNGKDGWNVGTPSRSGDYFLPGTRYEGFKIQFGNSVYSNINNGLFEIQGDNVSLNTNSFGYVANWQGEVEGNFKITQKIEFDVSETFLKFTIKVKNMSSNTVPVYYSKMSDPDQEYTIYGTYDTNNAIVKQANASSLDYTLLTSKGTTAGIYLGYYSEDYRSKGAFSLPWDLTPKQYFEGQGGAIISGNPNGDVAQSITFFEPNLASGAETEFVFYLLTNESDLSKVFCNPKGNISAVRNTTYNGQSVDLNISLEGKGPWTYTINGVNYSSSIPNHVISVSPSESTEYILSNVANSCGVSSLNSKTTISVIACEAISAAISGSSTITYGSSTNLAVTFTGSGPFNFEINNVAYSSQNSPFILSVSPPDNTSYELSNVSNFCGVGTSSGVANITINVPCDSYEPNNIYSTSTSITSLPFVSNQMCFHRAEDVDWFKIKIKNKDFFIEVKFLNKTSIGNYRLKVDQVGGLLNIETISLGEFNIDTYLNLYDSDGISVLASNDDGGVGFFSKIVYNICPTLLELNNINLNSGIYFAQNYIESTSNLSSNTSFAAGNSILLKPGFEVGQNEVFMAEIKNCMSLIPEVEKKVLTIQPGPIDGKDADVTMNNPFLNSGNNAFVDPYCWTQSGDINIKRVFIEFPLTSLPINAIIDSAFVNFYFSQTLVETFNYFFPGHTVGNNSLMIYRNLSAWNENSINWSNQPGFDSSISVEIPAAINQTQDYIDIPVTNLVNEMILNGNYGFQIRHKIEEPYKITCLTSSEESNSLKRPKLVIYYH